jgi:hypothetical protein
MVFRTRYRLSSVPLPMVALCVASLIGLVALLVVPAVKEFLADQMSSLPLIAMAVTALAPVVFLAWYVFSFAEVRRGRFRIRSLLGGGTGVDLKTLAVADVHAKSRSGSKRQRFELILRLEDEAGNEVWVPLNSWRDEDLLMARLLRATVERRVKIGGDPMLVRRFSGLLDTYKSWDRQQAAA